MFGSQPHGQRPSAPVTILQALRSSLKNCQPAIARARLRVEVDAEVWLLNNKADRALTSWLDSALTAAVERSPAGGELLISVCHTLRGLEIEVADDGEFPVHTGSHAFAPCQTRQVLGRRNRKSCQREIGRGSARHQHFYARCPQGGVANTFVMTESIANRARRVA